MRLLQVAHSNEPLVVVFLQFKLSTVYAALRLSMYRLACRAVLLWYVSKTFFSAPVVSAMCEFYVIGGAVNAAVLGLGLRESVFMLGVPSVNDVMCSCRL